MFLKLCFTKSQELESICMLHVIIAWQNLTFFLKKILYNSDRIELFRTKFYSINNSDFIKTWPR